MQRIYARTPPCILGPIHQTVYYCSQKGADKISKDHGVKTLPLEIDVTKAEQVEKALAQVFEHFGNWIMLLMPLELLGFEVWVLCLRSILE